MTTSTEPARGASSDLERLRLLIARLEHLVGPLEGEVTPQAATDGYGNPGFVAPGELIESAWGNATANRVIRAFADAPSRASAWPSPPEGARSYITTTRTDWSYVGGTWVRVRPALHAYAAIGADSGVVAATPTVVPGMQVSLTVETGNRVLVLTGGTLAQTGAPGSGTIHAQIRNDAAQVADQATTVDTGKFTALNVSTVVTPTAGAHTYSFAMYTAAGGVNVAASAGAPGWIMAQDIGPP